MNPDGTMGDVSGKYANMDRFEAREMIVSALEQVGLLKKIEPYHLWSMNLYQKLKKISQEYNLLSMVE